MCLLKRDEQDQNCNHDECKSYYMLNKQICMYHVNPLQKGNNSQNTMMTAQTMKNPLLLSSEKQGPNSSLQKLARPATLQGIMLEQEANHAHKKKIKVEDEMKEIESLQNFLDMNKLSDLQLQSNFSQPTTNQAIFNNSLLNNLLVSQQTAPKPEIPSLNNTNFLIPFLQSNQQQTTQSQQNVLTNQLNQLFNTSQKSGKTLNSTVNEIKSKNESNAATEAFLKEFQSRILGLLCTQNKMLVDLKEKNEMMQDTLGCLINELTSLKSIIKQNAQEKVAVPANPLVMHQIIGNSTESVTVDNLMTYLYGPNPEFQYNIVLKSELSLPLYRERNFKFTVLLTDNNGNAVENTNRIPLTIGIYSSENPPKYIDSNTAGNKILKGFIEKDLINGTASFEKIQIKEVTSHFRNGWIFFVVYPKCVNTSNNILMTGNENIINAAKIKPLILEKVIVKAKKTKEKDDSNNQDDRDENKEDE